MKWFINFSISKKMIVGFLIVAILAAIVGGVGIINITNMKQADKNLYNNESLGLQYSGDAAVEFMQLRYFILKMTTVTNTADIKSTKDSITEFQTATDESFKQLSDITFENKDIEALNSDLITALTEYEKDITQYLSYVDAGQTVQANDLVSNEMAPLGETLRDNCMKLSQLVADEAKSASDKNAQTATNAIVIMVVVLAVAVVIAILLGVSISGIISKPIRKMAKVADMLAVGDIDVDGVLDASDKQLKDQPNEIGGLALAFHNLIVATTQQVLSIQAMADGDLTVDFTVRSDKDTLGKGLIQLVDNLNHLIGTIATSSEQVTSGSTMVSHSSMALSQGATEQASAVEQLTASLQEITAQTHTNATNAGKANELAREAKDNASNGNGQMKDMLKAMEDINVSSSSINKIIKVIDDIAFQTNILALNAAVEAARAGQHGKGFAVVAEEVRTLAARSANAAKETTDLIESSIKKVETGTKIANETANALGQIVEQVDKAAELVNSIAVASTEQAHGIEQISQGISQVSQVVQTNAATAEESAAASEELSAQAVQLNETIGVFKTRSSSKAIGGDTNKTSSKFNAQPSRQISGRTGQSPASAKKIALSDNEFGKY
jgi:methyl-accepting chemotaxis protein